MTGIYGHKWVTSYGAEVSETWVRGCADLTGDELARGLRSCLKRSKSFLSAGDEDWPPTLGEFHLLCRPQRPVYHLEYPALSAPKLAPEDLSYIENDIKELRRMLRAAHASEATVAREPGSDDELTGGNP